MKDILHLDLDAFYPSVEVLDNPKLRGRPVIVGGSSKRGVVSSASYEARAFGVHSALPMAKAMRLCPHGIFLPVRMARYREISQKVFELFFRFTPLVEPLSLDEAFLDVTASTGLFGAPPSIAAEIKSLVLKETGLTISAGVGPSKFIAKIASDLHKPDGLTVVARGGVEAFLEPLPVEKLWGVGQVTHRRLLLLGVKTIGDLSRVPPAVLESTFGKQGLHMHLLSRGIDDRDVEPEHDTKSIGSEETYPEDLTDAAAIRKEILALSMQVACRARSATLAGKTVTLKVKYSDFQQVTRSVTLREPTDDGMVLYRQSCGLLGKTEAGRRPLRLLGVTLSRFETQAPLRQPSLFDGQEEKHKKKRLNRALDAIADKYGAGAIVPGTLMDTGKPSKKGS